MEFAVGSAQVPFVGPSDKFHGATLSCRVIERDPTTHHSLGSKPRMVCAILVVTEGSSPCWFPNQIILQDTCALPIG